MKSKEFGLIILLTGLLVFVSQWQTTATRADMLYIPCTQKITNNLTDLLDDELSTLWLLKHFHQNGMTPTRIVEI